MVGIWNYCVDSKTNLSRLAFDVYDRNASGTITEADLEGMLVDVWGENWQVFSKTIRKKRHVRQLDVISVNSFYTRHRLKLAL